MILIFARPKCLGVGLGRFFGRGRLRGLGGRRGSSAEKEPDLGIPNPESFADWSSTWMLKSFTRTPSLGAPPLA